MAYLFGDSFDFYGVMADMSTRWENVVQPNGALLASASTAYASGQALNMYSDLGQTLQKTLASNETTIYFSVRIKTPNVSSGAQYVSWSFQDGSAVQMSLRFQCNGSIVVYSGSGTALGTFVAAFGTAWGSVQGKIVINGTTGSVEMRKNGNTANDYTLTGVNTRAGSTNSYVNTWAWTTPYNGNGGNLYFDDLFLCSGSGASPNTWPGDLRAVQQVPTAATQAQFTTFPAQVGTSSTGGGTQTLSTNYMLTGGIQTSAVAQTITGGLISLSAAMTGNLVVSIWGTTAGAPTTRLGYSTVIVNPTIGLNAFTFVSPVTLTAGQTFYFAGGSNNGAIPNCGPANVANYFVQDNNTYPPSASLTWTANAAGTNRDLTIYIPAASNTAAVANLTNDGDTTYVYTSTVGNEDIYSLSAIPTTFAVVGVTFLAAWKKMDAGSRSAAIMVQANGSADTLELTNAGLSTGYSYSTVFLPMDPTSTAWTPTTVNGAKLGLKLAA